jgi:tRNA ligase
VFDVFINISIGVKEFTDDVRTQGSLYNGNPVEGFVVRGKLQDGRRHFFKVKYDDPYLMYREWREITKKILSGNPYKIKYPESKGYVEWVNKAIVDRPQLFSEYMHNRGIIKVRDIFLSETSGTGPQLESTLVEGMDKLSIKEPKIVLLPVATIGSGKTVFGGVCKRLFNAAHIQNDNITRRRNKNNPYHPFTEAVLEALKTNDIVYADRNNHLRFLRKDVTYAVKSVYPAAKVIALNWNVTRGNATKILEVTSARVEER